MTDYLLPALARDDVTRRAVDQGTRTCHTCRETYFVGRIMGERPDAPYECETCLNAAAYGALASLAVGE